MMKHMWLFHLFIWAGPFGAWCINDGTHDGAALCDDHVVIGNLAILESKYTTRKKEKHCACTSC